MEFTDYDHEGFPEKLPLEYKLATEGDFESLFSVSRNYLMYDI